MKNLFDLQVKEEIILRIGKLSPDTSPHWGKMNVNQGMRHMRMAFDIPTGKLDPTISKVPPMPKWLLKFFLLNVRPPKERVETFQEMNMVSRRIDPSDFEAERASLKRAVEDFFHADNLINENKMGGRFTRKDWGKLNYNHTDHHLRQFGV
jgi:hypothetical protein